MALRCCRLEVTNLQAVGDQHGRAHHFKLPPAWGAMSPTPLILTCTCNNEPILPVMLRSSIVKE